MGHRPALPMPVSPTHALLKMEGIILSKLESDPDLPFYPDSPALQVVLYLAHSILAPVEHPAASAESALATEGLQDMLRCGGPTAGDDRDGHSPQMALVRGRSYPIFVPSRPCW